MASALLKIKPDPEEEEAQERANDELKESEEVSKQLERLRKEQGGTFSRDSERTPNNRGS
ncbi:MAG TPA: hypothetical protein VGR71_14065 [Nitrospira sp.]|nr:hypothetical protein [Nitrospira sp.]